MKNFSLLDYMILISCAGIFVHCNGDGAWELGVIITLILLVVKFIVWIATKLKIFFN